MLSGESHRAWTLLELVGAGPVHGISPVSALEDPAAARDGRRVGSCTDGGFPRLQSMSFEALRTDRYKYLR